MTKSTKLSTAAETFIDTSGFYALLVQGDRAHKRAKAVMSQACKSRARFVTTDYILDETATLLRARGQTYLTDSCFAVIFSSQACRVEWMDPGRFEPTRCFFAKHADKKWSFTDCFSFWLMGSLGIRDALTSDEHFRQAGFHPLLA